MVDQQDQGWMECSQKCQLQQDQIGQEKDEVGSGGQSVGLEGPPGSRGKPTGSQGLKGWSYRVPRGQGVGLQGPRGSRGRPTGSEGSRGMPTACRLQGPGGQRVQSPLGTQKSWPSGSQGLIGGPRGFQGSTGRFDGSSYDYKPDMQKNA